jgi:hypothetical protein
MSHLKRWFIPLLLALTPLSSYGLERIGSLGVGMTNQVQNNLPSISFKLQRSRRFAIGGLLGFNNDDTGGGHAAALKIYRNLIDEPQLVFFGSVLAGMIKQKVATVETSGFQVDITMGSEFSFSGLQSLGFSFEFGVSLNKMDDFIIETVGHSFIVSSIHFYL